MLNTTELKKENSCSVHQSAQIVVMGMMRKWPDTMWVNRKILRIIAGITTVFWRDSTSIVLYKESLYDHQWEVNYVHQWKQHVGTQCGRNISLYPHPSLITKLFLYTAFSKISIYLFFRQIIYPFPRPVQHKRARWYLQIINSNFNENVTM